MDNTTLAVLIATLSAYFVILIIYAVIWIIANWRIFTKAGEAGWKSIIPVYNSFILYKISWNTMFFWVMLALTVVGSIFTAAFPDSTVMLVLGWICNAAAVVLGIVQLYKLSLAFGHGAGFFLGLLFLNPIFILILAFGSSEYKGIPE